jgi:hypothetical protein
VNRRMARPWMPWVGVNDDGLSWDGFVMVMMM